MRKQGIDRERKESGKQPSRICNIKMNKLKLEILGGGNSECGGTEGRSWARKVKKACSWATEISQANPLEKIKAEPTLKQETNSESDIETKNEIDLVIEMSAAKKMLQEGEVEDEGVAVLLNCFQKQQQSWPCIGEDVRMGMEDLFNPVVARSPASPPPPLEQPALSPHVVAYKDPKSIVKIQVIWNPHAPPPPVEPRNSTSHMVASRLLSAEPPWVCTKKIQAVGGDDWQVLQKMQKEKAGGAGL